jgi:predicted transcriptional regulator
MKVLTKAVLELMQIKGEIQLFGDLESMKIGDKIQVRYTPSWGRRFMEIVEIGGQLR